MRVFGIFVFSLATVVLYSCSSVFSQVAGSADELLKEGYSIYQNNPEKAVTLAFQARSKSNTEQRAKGDILLMKAYNQTGKVDSAIFYGNEAVTLAKLLEDADREASYTDRLARLHLNIGESEKALNLYERAFNIYEQLSDSAHMGQVLNSIGISYKKMGLYPEAKENYNKSLIIREAIGDKNRVAQTTNNIGNVLRYEGKLDSALIHYLAALAVFEELYDSINMTNSMNNIGLVHKGNGNDDLALKYYKRVFKIRSLLGDERGLQSIRNNIAIIYRQRGMLDSALFFFNQNYDYAWSHGIKDAEALALHNAASVYMDDGQWDKAVQGFKNALSIRTGLKDRWGSASCNQNLGECYFRMGEYAKAIPYAEAALDISTKIGSETQQVAILKILHKSYSKLGDYENAYKYQHLQKAVSDSLFIVERSASISEMEANYENEKSEQAVTLANERNALQEEKIKRQQTTRNYLYVIIALTLLIVLVYVQRTRVLRKTNSELFEQKDELAKNAQEKEMLLNEIHHRVKNNLQVVSSLLNMQSREVKDEKVLSALKEGRDRVHSMSLVHQMFYQEHEDAASIEAHKYIEQLCNSLLRSYGGDKRGISLSLEVDECLLDIDRATLIGLIVNELVSNSLKYAFKGKEAGVLTVSLKLMKKNIALTVSDNGAGKSEKTRDSSSFGLKLVDSMTKKLKGKLTTVTEGGYSTKIVFPKTK
jgi:two-component sensor histidine kinase